MKQKSSHSIVFYALIVAALFLCSTASVQTSALAQQPTGQRKPKIAEDEKTPHPTPTPRPNNTRPGKVNRNKGTPRTTRPGTVATPPRATQTTQATMLLVTFATQTPGASIVQNLGDGRHTNLGTTGADGRLIVQLARGTYMITASHPSFSASRQYVEVRPGNTTFNFQLGAQPASQPATASAGGSIEDVFRRFLDPRQTDAVTLKDWQFVQQRAVALLIDSPFNIQLRVQALFAEGQAAYLSGDYGHALTAFNNAALALPDSALAFYGLGNAYLATNQLSEAGRAYQRAVQINGTLAMAHNGYAEALARQGKNEEAQRYYERARALGYTSATASHNAARILMKQGRWTQALRELSELVKKRPQVELFIDIGDCYVGMKQLLSAARAYQSAMQLNPQSALAHYKYGEVMFESREYQTALESLEKSLVLDQQGTVINRRRARDLANKSAERLRRM
ncbi:MAG TPA: tetratricopeptide repeat protein [Pyrinomonadaceae bacterium]|jgi:tetratricopeptide (TPR) repeat protein